jgi:hypothetical protein
MATDKEKRTIDSLKAIYAVIIGLAIKDAIEVVAKDETINCIIIKIFLLLTFFMIAIPFFHGMNRHLDAYYVHVDEKNKQKQGLLLFDFFAFFSEACFLFFFAINLCRYWDGYQFLGIMLSLDLIWAIVLLIFLKKPVIKKDQSNLTIWIFLDICALGLGYLVFFLDCKFVLGMFYTTMIICFLAIIRTFSDFGLLWTFYFPKD